MKKGDTDTARLYAENAIRTKKESLNVRKFGCKMGALSQKIESAYRT